MVIQDRKLFVSEIRITNQCPIFTDSYNSYQLRYIALRRTTNR